MNDELIRQSEALSPQLEAKQKKALAVGVVGGALTIVGYLTDDHFFQSYLLAFIYWISLTLGCLAVLMLHHLAGGRWGFATRRVFEAGTQTLPWMLVLGLPVLLGIHELYHWSHPEAVATDEVLQQKSGYLNTTFFIVRFFIYFAIWGILAFLLNSWSAQQDLAANDTSPTRRMQVLSGPGMVVFVLSATLAVVDWIMSLEPHWFSTIFAAIYIIGAILFTWAFTILIAVPLSAQRPLSALLTNERLRDIGTLMLAFVMLWAYASFSQLVIIWSGNLPEEITWYVSRLQGGWEYIGYGLIAFHFALPFVLLVSSRIKSRIKVLVTIAGGVIVMRLVDLFWITAPAFGMTELSVSWLDVVIPVGFGGIWLYVFFGHLKKRSLVPLNDPRFDFAALAAAEEHG